MAPTSMCGSVATGLVAGPRNGGLVADWITASASLRPASRTPPGQVSAPGNQLALHGNSPSRVDS